MVFFKELFYKDPWKRITTPLPRNKQIIPKHKPVQCTIKIHIWELNDKIERKWDNLRHFKLLCFGHWIRIYTRPRHIILLKNKRVRYRNSHYREWSVALIFPAIIIKSANLKLWKGLRHGWHMFIIRREGQRNDEKRQIFTKTA